MPLIRQDGSHDGIRSTALHGPGPGPLVVRAEGCDLITDDGRRIIDAAGGAGRVQHRSRPSRGGGGGRGRDAPGRLRAATWPTPRRLALADALVERWLPEGHGHVFLAGGGSEANDTAIRLARSYHVARGDLRRFKVIGRMPSYHGSTLATLSIGGTRPDVPLRAPARRDAEGAVERRRRSRRRHRGGRPETVAAFIAEPVIGAAAGALVPDADYWSTVAEVCAHYGVLTIADEVMTGFGRTGRRWGTSTTPGRPTSSWRARPRRRYVPISLVSAHAASSTPSPTRGGR